jgi:hypothetical protein
LGGLHPYKLGVLLEEGGEWGGDLGVVLYKAAVKVGKTKKALDIKNGLRSGPILNGGYFGRIHRD